MNYFKTLTLEVTTCCQANCIMCVRDKLKYKPDSMSQQLFEKAIKQVEEFLDNSGNELEFIDLGGMGEPLLDTQLENKLKWLRQNYPDVKVGITTNGQLLMDKKDILCKYTDVLKISNYGFSKESFESIHRGSLVFEDIKMGLEEFLRISKENRPKTIMSFLMLNENKGEEILWKNYWEKRCDDIYIWMPHNWAGYKTSHTNQNHDKCNSCGRPGKDFTVRANGDVSACCWDFNRELTIGNLNKSSFEEMYNGTSMKEILDMHINKSFYETENICKYCDQLYDRSDALIYSSNKNFTIHSRTTADSI